MVKTLRFPPHIIRIDLNRLDRLDIVDIVDIVDIRQMGIKDRNIFNFYITVLDFILLFVLK